MTNSIAGSRILGEDPAVPKGYEKPLLFGNYSPWKRRPPLCHLDRSAAQWRDVCVDALSWKGYDRDNVKGPHLVGRGPFTGEAVEFG